MCLRAGNNAKLDFKVRALDREIRSIRNSPLRNVSREILLSYLQFVLFDVIHAGKLLVLLRFSGSFSREEYKISL